MRAQAHREGETLGTRPSATTATTTTTTTTTMTLPGSLVTGEEDIGGRRGQNHHFQCNSIGVTQVCTMGWCRYVQITWATSCGTAESHEDSTAIGATYSLPAYNHWGGKQLIRPYWTVPCGVVCGAKAGRSEGCTMLCAYCRIGVKDADARPIRGHYLPSRESRDTMAVVRHF